MTTEQEFLCRVAARHGRPVLMRPPVWEQEPLPEYGLTDSLALAERFALELEKLGGKAYRAGSPSEIGPAVVGILQAGSLAGNVVRWEDPTLAGLGLDEALAAAGYSVTPFTPERSAREGPTLVEAAEQAVAGITGCDWAIAETGSLVLGSSSVAGGPGRGRVVSLLPPVHIAVVRKEQFVYSALSVLRKLGSVGRLPSQVIFATGPSRTSDIENDLAIGVHGPGQLHVVIC